MYRRNHRNGNGPARHSTCGDITVKGSVSQIAVKYEELAREAAVAGDERMRHIYLNHAEHYRKAVEG